MRYNHLDGRQAHNHSCDLTLYISFGVDERIKHIDASAYPYRHHQPSQTILWNESRSMSPVLLSRHNDLNLYDAIIASASLKLRLVISLLPEQHRQERILFVNLTLLLSQCRHTALAIPQLDTSERAKLTGAGCVHSITSYRNTCCPFMPANWTTDWTS